MANKVAAGLPRFGPLSQTAMKNGQAIEDSELEGRPLAANPSNYDFVAELSLQTPREAENEPSELVM